MSRKDTMLENKIKLMKFPIMESKCHINVRKYRNTVAEVLCHLFCVALKPIVIQDKVICCFHRLSNRAVTGNYKKVTSLFANKRQMS